MLTQTQESEQIQLPAISVALSWVNPFDLFLGMALLGLILLEIPLSSFLGVELPINLISSFPWSEAAAYILAIGFCCTRRNLRLREAAVFSLWTALWLSPLTYLFHLAARSPFGLVDSQLAVIDGWLRINTAAIHQAAMGQRWYIVWDFFYTVYIPVISLAAIVPCLCGFPGACRRFIVGTIAALITGAVIFVFFPAIGPWASEAMRPTTSQFAMGDYLSRLKMHLPIRAELAHSAIVSFPSEHVAVSILSARALSSIRAIRIPAWILCVLVCASTIPTGWHYGVDVLGGIAVGIVCIWVADKICRAIEAITWQRIGA